MRFLYASAPCGSGKTHQIVVRACKMALRGILVVIVQPSIELINKTIGDELLSRPNPPIHRVFHGESVPEGQSVAMEFAEYLRSPQDGGQIIFITHQVLALVKFWPNKKDLHLLIDEDIQVVRHENLRLPDTHQLITDDIKVVPYNADFGKVECGNSQSLKSKARNIDEDAVLAILAETLRTITNPNWDTFVNLEQYANLCKGNGHTLAFHSLLKPAVLAGFGSVFIAAAMFEDTAIYRLWTEAGVQFTRDTKFTDSLRYSTHPNGSLMTFYYVTEDRWSKRLRDKVLEDVKVLDLILAGAAKLFSEANFAWQANADYTDDPFGPKGSRLPNKPHGLNSYSHLHDIVFVSSLNPNPDHIKFLNSRGLSSDAIRACIYFATCYQSVMRISTRNPDDTNLKRILVPDLGAAKYLQDLFPGSKIEWLDVGIPKYSMVKKGGRPKKHPSNAARRSQQRKNEQERLLNGLRDLIGHKFSQDNLKCGCLNGGAENPIRSISSIGTVVADGLLFKTKHQSQAFGFVSCESSGHFVLLLHEIWSENILLHKEDNQLISPAMFDPELSPNTDRGLANIVYTRHLWLDFEGGDLKPEEFPKLFPQLRMAVFNSYNHTAENPRFRVVIPTTDIMTPEIYSALQGHIRSKLEDSGYSVEKTNKKPVAQSNTLRSGLDCGKQSPSSLFYLPSQAQDPKDSFFCYYEGDGREFLDAAVWVENGEVSIAPEPDEWNQEDYLPSDSNQVAVNGAIARWLSTPPGHGHTAFFQLAVDLRGAGMGAVDIEVTLSVQARFGRSKKDRKAEIPGIMDALKKSRISLRA